MGQGAHLMGMADALWGGFSAFYSIWQLCILQFSPFFLAFIVGLFFVAPGQPDASRVFRLVIPPSLAWTFCFTFFYSLLIASALSLTRPLINNLAGLRILAGILILLVGLFLLLGSRLAAIGRLRRPATSIGLALVIGFSFALMYSPCITPMLSDIMALASQRSTVGEGWYLAFFYGLGTSIAMCVFASALIAVLVRWNAARRNARRIADTCALVLFVLALMNISGWMTYYKAFLLGLAL